MNQPLPVAVIVGVDTHKVMHAAVAISNVGARLGEITVPASANGYRDLAAWARSLGAMPTFGIEGTGSYGAGLSRFLCEQALLFWRSVGRTARCVIDTVRLIFSMRRTPRDRPGRSGDRSAKVWHEHLRDDPSSEDRP